MMMMALPLPPRLTPRRAPCAPSGRYESGATGWWRRPHCRLRGGLRPDATLPRLMLAAALAVVLVVALLVQPAHARDFFETSGNLFSHSETLQGEILAYHNTASDRYVDVFTVEDGKLHIHYRDATTQTYSKTVLPIFVLDDNLHKLVNSVIVASKNPEDFDLLLVVHKIIQNKSFLSTASVKSSTYCVYKVTIGADRSLKNPTSDFAKSSSDKTLLWTFASEPGILHVSGTNEISMIASVLSKETSADYGRGAASKPDPTISRAGLPAAADPAADASILELDPNIPTLFVYNTRLGALIPTAKLTGMVPASASGDGGTPQAYKIDSLIYLDLNGDCKSEIFVTFNDFSSYGVYKLVYKTPNSGSEDQASQLPANGSGGGSSSSSSNADSTGVNNAISTKNMENLLKLKGKHYVVPFPSLSAADSADLAVSSNDAAVVSKISGKVMSHIVFLDVNFDSIPDAVFISCEGGVFDQSGKKKKCALEAVLNKALVEASSLNDVNPLCRGKDNPKFDFEDRHSLYTFSEDQIDALASLTSEDASLAPNGKLQISVIDYDMDGSYDFVFILQGQPFILLNAENEPNTEDNAGGSAGTGNAQESSSGSRTPTSAKSSKLSTTSSLAGIDMKFKMFKKINMNFDEKSIKIEQKAFSISAIDLNDNGILDLAVTVTKDDKTTVNTLLFKRSESIDAFSLRACILLTQPSSNKERSFGASRTMNSIPLHGGTVRLSTKRLNGENYVVQINQRPYGTSGVKSELPCGHVGLPRMNNFIQILSVSAKQEEHKKFQEVIPNSRLLMFQKPGSLEWEIRMLIDTGKHILEVIIVSIIVVILQLAFAIFFRYLEKREDEKQRIYWI